MGSRHVDPYTGKPVSRQFYNFISERRSGVYRGRAGGVKFVIEDRWLYAVPVDATRDYESVAIKYFSKGYVKVAKIKEVSLANVRRVLAHAGIL